MTNWREILNMRNTWRETMEMINWLKTTTSKSWRENWRHFPRR